MKFSNDTWKHRLSPGKYEDLFSEIDIFENELILKKQGKIDDRVIAETRLRRGVYGQRYDNGQRHDGLKVQHLSFPSGELTKGPNTLWDAPGMLRIKIPFGGVNAEQLETLAELAEEYSNGVAHITTRQDFQYHYIQLEDTPALMRRLAAVGITTREACGNTVRNVTGCPYAGVCTGEAFDITPYAKALSRFLLGHPDTQEFGRKFKPSFSGCKEEACGLANMHDLGAIAVMRTMNGEEVRGFELYIGGGLGAVPNQAKLFDAFLPPEELLPVAQAIARVFTRLGEKKNRNRARLKFLVTDLGIEEFRRLVLEERKTLPDDPRWVDYIREAEGETQKPLISAETTIVGVTDTEGYRRWVETNVRRQRQDNFVMVTVALPLGDVTSDQLRSLADMARKFTSESIRTTVEQNFLIRWIKQESLPLLYEMLSLCGLNEPTAGTILDIVACPGTDTCKLGISASRGLAAELRNRLAEASYATEDAVQNLRIKISGCFNSCGQHHVADLGFYGVSRTIGGFRVPHFQVVVGGERQNNGGAFGLPILAVPSKRIPDVVSRITKNFVENRIQRESFQDFVHRIGKAAIKTLLEDLTSGPADPQDRSIFQDWGDVREYSNRDIGIGECAGEVVTLVEFGLSASEREVFEAQLELEAGKSTSAGQMALKAMVTAASALIRIELEDLPTSRDQIVAEFRTRFFDTKKFHDPFAGGKFANYFFVAHEKANGSYSSEAAHHLIEEAQLFIEAAHGLYNRMTVISSK